MNTSPLKPKILVVDDDIDILGLVTLLLASKDYKVHSLCRAEETFESAKKFRPDLILLDVNLAGYDGREICKQLKCDEVAKHIPVILFSATPGVKETYHECEAADFIAKPFNGWELIETIERHLKVA